MQNTFLGQLFPLLLRNMLLMILTRCFPKLGNQGKKAKIDGSEVIANSTPLVLWFSRAKTGFFSQEIWHSNKSCFGRFQVFCPKQEI